MTQALSVPRNQAAYRLIRHPEVCWFAAWYDGRGFAHDGKQVDTEHEAIAHCNRLHAQAKAKARRYQWARR